MKKVVAIPALIIVSLIILLIITASFLSGVLAAVGTISLTILSNEPTVFIQSPQPITYNFDEGPFIIDLNVSSNFDADIWSYSHKDMRHDEIIADFGFAPNTTFEAVRWQNRITVFAQDSQSDKSASATVDFFIKVPNSPPQFGQIDDNIYVCEGSPQNQVFLSKIINATDYDEDKLTFEMNPPQSKFFLEKRDEIITNFTFSEAEIFSGNLFFEDIGTYPVTLLVNDLLTQPDNPLSDSKDVNIDVLEVNNPPVFQEDLPVQTKVYTQGDNQTLSLQVLVDDQEDGNQDGGKLVFSLSFDQEPPLFDISPAGFMEYTAQPEHLGNYLVDVCAKDSGIPNPSPQLFEQCDQDGSSNTTCETFQLTVTDENRPPTITDNYPKVLSFNASGVDNIYFNITEYDPDKTIPDAYWYVDSELIEKDKLNLIDEFSYAFECGVSGIHKVKAEITDGLLNDSIEWHININRVSCFTLSGGGGGGGGGGSSPKKVCEEKWACDTWQLCQNAQSSLELGIISGADFRIIKKKCGSKHLNEETCGFQIRDCIDLNTCNTEINNSNRLQECYFTENPNCLDGIKNCHDDACEFLIDCRGPCDACATCSDEIQNQGEEGADCGGPCPNSCPENKPKLPILNYILITLIIIISLIIIYKFRKIMRIEKKLEE